MGWHTRVKRGRPIILSPNEFLILDYAVRYGSITWKNAVKILRSESKCYRAIKSLTRRNLLLKKREGYYIVTEKGVRAVNQYRLNL